MTGKRLPLDTYSLPYVWHVTIHAAAETTPFMDGSAALECVRFLKASAEKYQAQVLVYCVMPDHVHLLAQNSAGTDLINFIRHFKQATGYAFKQQHGANLWQKSFYDRALRRDEDLEAIIRYILDNPVKAGLAEKSSDYKYSGSFIFNVADLVAVS